MGKQYQPQDDINNKYNQQNDNDATYNVAQ